MNRKVIYILLILSSLISCNLKKEKEENQVINDFVNQYLEQEYLGKVLDFDTLQNYPKIKQNILDTSQVKVQISRAQIPIQILKEDDYWLFTTRYKGSDKKEFEQMLKESNLANDFRIIDTAKIKLDKPFQKFYGDLSKLKDRELYAKIRLSRVVFNKNMDKAIIVTDYAVSNPQSIGFGEYKSFLLTKIDGKWTYLKNNK